MKRYYLVAGISFAAIAALSVGQILQAQTQSRSFNFQGRFLAVLSDADMEASAYIDGRLGERTPEMRDTLTLIPLGNGSSKVSPTTLPISNSVMAWPNNLAFTPDGRFAFVTETFRPAPQGATERSQIPPGRQLAVIEVSQPQQPKVVQRINLGTRPMAVTVHPDGNLLAVSLGESGRQIALIPFNNGRLGTPTFQGHPNLNDANVHTPHVEWHPSGRFLGVTLPDRNEALFYAIDRTNPSRPKLRSWGNTIMTGKHSGVGHFTPDGRHFIVTNLYWGDDVAVAGSQHSSLTVIEFANVTSSNNQVKHQIVSTAAVGGSAEEFAISPNGRFVVSLNMEASYLPLNDPRMTRHSSLTLLGLNPETGRLTLYGTTVFEGILPEGITFDASGNYLAVATFDYHDPQQPGGAVDFWRMIQNGRPTLQKLDRSIPVMRGAHIVKLVR
ncbi:MAG: beta-propeller fold lactonase family protein [Nostoc sp. ChiQUE01a]|nr:beta-propeller fold lactonase family protein [Nostoc sp. ChiQUE01a]